MKECYVVHPSLSMYQHGVKGIIKNNIVYLEGEDGSESISGIPYDRHKFPENLTQINVDKKWGYANLDTGEVTIKPTWDYTEPFYCKRAIIEDQCKYGVIDISGEYIIPLIYDFIETDYIDGELFFYASKNRKTGLFDKNGNNIIDFQYEEIRLINNERLCVLKEGKWGIVDINNQILFDFNWDKIEYRGSTPFMLAGIKDKQRPLLEMTEAVQNMLNAIFGPNTSGNDEREEYYEYKWSVFDDQYNLIIAELDVQPFPYSQKYSDYYIIKRDGKYGVLYREKLISNPELFKKDAIKIIKDLYLNIKNGVV